MFGKNVISKHEPHEGTLVVQEIFPTLQGEGPFSGWPAIFVRLAGCNLACTFCDTQFDTGLDNRLPIQTVVDQVKHHWDELSVRYSANHKGLVVITGGEPFRQDAVVGLIAVLVAEGFVVQIETAGTLWPANLELVLLEIPWPQFCIVCSPKTPTVNQNIRARSLHWKYVVRSGETSTEDGLPMRGTQPATFGTVQKLARPPDGATVWVSPCDDYDEVKNKMNQAAAAEIALRFGYRLSLQVHKLVDLP